MILRSINQFVRTPFFVLAIVEALLLYFAIPIATLVFGDAVSSDPRILRNLVFSAAIMLALVAVGLYQVHQRNRFDEIVVRVGVGFLGGIVALIVIYALFPAVAVSIPVFVCAVFFGSLGILADRLAFSRFIDESVFRRKVIVYGAGERSAAILDLRRRADRRGFSLVGQVQAPGDNVIEEIDTLTKNGESLLQLAEERGADEIVVAMDDRRGNLPIRELLDCKLRGINVIDLVEFLERESGKIRVDLVNPSWLILSPGFRATRTRRAAKRALDLASSGIGLLLASPLMLFVWLAIKIEDGLSSPTLYRQTRVGLHGDVFEVLKFRSMRVDAESDGEARWASEDDDRVTRVGVFIRKFRLDEMPQLLNVLRGQMSLVGPRPERPEFVEELAKKIPYYAERHSIQPGITGWAQMNYPYGSSDQDAHEKLQYDLYYVKNHNTLLDLVIILQTVEVVLWGRGAR